jgi:phosphate-selective porin OprO/OprP
VGYTIRDTALAVAMLGMAQAALADTAETKGGLKVKTDDGRFEFNLNGRVHYDVYAFEADTVEATAGSFFRRTRLTLSGKLYAWDYKFEEDFAGSGPSGYREIWIGTDLGPGKLHIGQMKAPRTMEELTSSNEITFMERPFASASGIFAGRQYPMGLFYLGNTDLIGYGVAVYNLAEQVSSAPVTEGVGATGRFYIAPLTEGTVLHFGVSASQEMLDDLRTAGPGSVRYAGRLSPTLALGTSAPTDEDVTTVQGEAAFAAGPFTTQLEYAQQTLGQTDPAPDQDVVTYYVQTSVFVTGESRPYDIRKGVFKSPKPNAGYGAWELAARYDHIENDDLAAQPEISTVLVGVNWYVNPNIRFMLNYGMPQAETATTTDEPTFVSLRTQLAF